MPKICYNKYIKLSLDGVKMFKIGEKIIYGVSGIYTLEDIREETVLGVKHTYYILNSDGGNQSKIYVPTDSETLVSAMRKPLSRKEAKALIADIKNIPEAEWHKDSRKRSAEYRTLMESGNPRDIISVIKALYKSAKSRLDEGKKVYMTDENSMRKAEKLLYSELSLALNIPEDDIPSYIKEQCEK